jgi:hypothetical protein
MLPAGQMVLEPAPKASPVQVTQVKSLLLKQATEGTGTTEDTKRRTHGMTFQETYRFTSFFITTNSFWIA